MIIFKTLIYNVTVCYNNYFVVISGISSISKETPNEYQILSRLIGISDKWYDIGLSLQVRRNVLDEIKQSEDNDVTKLKKVVNIWQDAKSSSTTWETMITAAESPVINNKEIADEIRQYLQFSKLLLLSNEVILLILSLSINCIVQTF